MSKDLYIEISAHFGIESVENLIADRRNRFINRYGETDIYVKCCADLFISLTVLFYLCCVTTYDGEIKLYILMPVRIYYASV